MYNAKLLQPIFVTNEERVEFEKIENKTKAYIIQEINNMSDTFPNKDYALTRKKEIKNSLKHHQVISLFYNVKLLRCYDVQKICKNFAGEYTCRIAISFY